MIIFLLPAAYLPFLFLSYIWTTSCLGKELSFFFSSFFLLSYTSTCMLYLKSNAKVLVLPLPFQSSSSKAYTVSHTDLWGQKQYETLTYGHNLIKHAARMELPGASNPPAKSSERKGYSWMMAKQTMKCGTYTPVRTHIYCFYTSCDQWLLTIILEGSPLDGSSLSKSSTKRHSERQFMFV